MLNAKTTAQLAVLLLATGCPDEDATGETSSVTTTSNTMSLAPPGQPKL